MSQSLTHLDHDIFTVDNLFSPEECATLIARGEALGFEAASVMTPDGPQMMPMVRNNDRVVFDDETLATELWDRIRDFVPQEIEGCSALGLHPRFRYYRYDPQQRFKRHKDGSVTGENGSESRLSFLIYLNEGYEGGETIFRDYRDKGEGKQAVETVVSGRTGMALCFAHKRWHEGARVLAGRKYLLRTDILYSAPHK